MWIIQQFLNILSLYCLCNVFLRDTSMQHTDEHTLIIENRGTTSTSSRNSIEVKTNSSLKFEYMATQP